MGRQLTYNPVSRELRPGVDDAKGVLSGPIRRTNGVDSCPVPVWILCDRVLRTNGASLPMHTAHVLLTSSLCGRRLTWLDVVVHTEKVCRIVLDF